MKQDLTDITIILDSSGSMNSCVSDTQGGLKKYIESQIGVTGECVISVINFANNHHVLQESKLVQSIDIEDLNTKYAQSIGGGTALYDTIGKVVDSVGVRLNATPEEARPGQVSIVIITDGQENSSHFYTLSRVKDMIKHQKEVYKWNFSFIGADITTDEALEMDIDSATSISIDKSKIGDALSMAGVKFATYRGSKNTNDLSYSAAERSVLS